MIQLKGRHCRPHYDKHRFVLAAGWLRLNNGKAHRPEVNSSIHIKHDAVGGQFIDVFRLNAIKGCRNSLTHHSAAHRSISSQYFHQHFPAPALIYYKHVPETARKSPADSSPWKSYSPYAHAASTNWFQHGQYYRLSAILLLIWNRLAHQSEWPVCFQNKGTIKSSKAIRLIKMLPALSWRKQTRCRNRSYAANLNNADKNQHWKCRSAFAVVWQIGDKMETADK